MCWYIFTFFDATVLPSLDRIILKVFWFGKTPLDEGSALRRHPYLTKHNTHNRETSMPSAGIEPAISAKDPPQNDALNRATTVIGCVEVLSYFLWGNGTGIKLQTLQCHVALLLSSAFKTAVAGLSETSENFWQINGASAVGQRHWYSLLL